MIWFIQTGKQRRTVFQYEILPYFPLPFPLINHFNQIKCHIVFRLVFFVLLFQNGSVNILVKHSPWGNSKQTILASSQKCLLLTNNLLTLVHNQILTDLNLHFSRSTVFKPWTGSCSLVSWRMRSTPSSKHLAWRRGPVLCHLCIKLENDHCEKVYVHRSCRMLTQFIRSAGSFLDIS